MTQRRSLDFMAAETQTNLELSCFKLWTMIGETLSPLCLPLERKLTVRYQLGILFTPTAKLGHQSFNVMLRRDLDIFASLSHLRNLEGCPTRYGGIDFAIIRENTEGEYSGMEHSPVPGVIESLKIVSRAKTERIAKFAFDFALKNGRKKVTAIHKANIMWVLR